MSLSFKTLRSPLLGLNDQISFGKFKGCRICDVVQDHYEYLIWAEKSGLVKYQPIVVETIQEMASFQRWEQHYAEEIAPYKEQADKIQCVYEVVSREGYYDTFEDDVPF